MWTAGRTAKKILQQPGAFARAVIKQFRANQGILLAGAVAYYTLLSLVPLLILILMALSHIVPEDRLLLTLSEYLEFVVPGQSAALVEEVRTFLAQKQVVGGILFVTMLFFSALAFTILENAMSVIFYHRVKIKRRHFLVSAIMPYLFILLLGVGLLIVTVLSGVLQFVGTRSIVVLGQTRSLDQISIFLLYIVGVTGEILLLTAIYFIMPVGRLSLRHALIGGVTATILWEIMRHILAWYYTTMSQIQRLPHHRDRRTLER
jgi:YihY family inner membrane protein